MRGGFDNAKTAVRLIVALLISGLLCPVPSFALQIGADSEISDQVGKSGVIPAFPVAEPIDPHEYVCGVGDQFVIRMWGKKEAVISVSITVEGELFIPSIGQINHLVGKNLYEVKQRIRSKIATVYTNLSYDVYLARPRSFIVYVAGFARTPGEQVANAIMRVSQLVRKVGGPNVLGSSRFVEVWRDGKLHTVIDFFRYHRFGQIDQDIYLLDGDLIKIPRRGRVVTINGAIAVPGTYELLDEENLRSLIDVQCDGYSMDLSPKDEIEIVRRFEADQFKVFRFGQDQVASADVELLDRDQIFVPTLDRYQKVIRVQGAIRGTGTTSLDTLKATEQLKEAASRPMEKGGEQGEVLPGAGQGEQMREYFGVFPYVEGETVSAVIRRAGGVTAWADTNNAFIRRPIPGKEKAFETISLDLTAILIQKDYTKDLRMQAGDFLIVPTIDTKVFVSGEVTEPGPQSYAPYYTVRYYMGLAGGETDRASMVRSKIIHKDGSKDKLNPDSIVRPGDTIHIQPKTFKFWQDYWAILTGAAATILSGYAVLYITNKDND